MIIQPCFEVKVIKNFVSGAISNHKVVHQNWEPSAPVATENINTARYEHFAKEVTDLQAEETENLSGLFW